MKSFQPGVWFSVMLIFSACGGSATREMNLTPAEKILDLSIAFHDPDGDWDTWEGRLEVKETRPDGNDIATTVWINNDEGLVRIRRGEQEFGMKQDSCFVIAGDVDCERAEFMRNYFLYLWGLPMKLKDPGTALSDRVDTLIWNSRNVLVLHVSYEKEDWSYYFDRNNFELTGYQFVKGDGTGEWIELYDTVKAGNMILPKERRWFVLLDSTHLGTDILTGD